MKIFIISPFFVYLATCIDLDTRFGKINGLLRVVAHVTPGLIFYQGLGFEQGLRKLN